MDAEALTGAFARACLDVFGEDRVEAIVLHGSAAKGGVVRGFSDIDFMVFLTQDCFSGDGALPDEVVFAVQERIGPLPWQDAGFLYPQASFYDARRVPEWWTGPAPGAHCVLWGAMPEGALPTAERLRGSSAHFLKYTLRDYIVRDLSGFIDADDGSVPRRLRLLGTSVAPTIFALLTPGSVDPLEVWALPKFEALARLKELYSAEDGPTLGLEFYENLRRLYGGGWNADLARTTFRLGIRFLRWAQTKASQETGGPLTSDTAAPVPSNRRRRA